MPNSTKIRIVRPDIPGAQNGQTLPPTAINRPTPPVPPAAPAPPTVSQGQ